ncbi:HAD-IA family hydrolase [Candidatus Woesearchaeota archaeon]|nr:HAD-IA family hydrolase [Candidatus Woesearchaeota archaeon]
MMIFDLDNTLFDTYNQLSKPVLGEMFRRMREAGMTEEQENQLRERYAFTGFKILASQLGLNADVIHIGMEAYEFMDMSHIKPYDDAKLLLKLPGKKILVTSGVPKVQQAKVDLLKIRDYFEQVIIDDSSDPKNKEMIFKTLMEESSLQPKEVMIIGDNPDSEILGGRNLGMVTVQILRHKGMREAECDYKIKELSELKGIIAVYD